LKNAQRVSKCLAVLLVLTASLSISYMPERVAPTTLTATAVSQLPIDPLFKEFEIPTNQSGPEAIIQDLHNNQLFWFTEYSAGKIGELWLNGTVEDFHIPEKIGANATGLAMDSQGNIWFADQAGAGSIWEFTPSLAPSAQAFKQYFTKTPDSYPYAVVIDNKGNVWFTEGTGDRIGEFPYGGDSSDNITEYPTPTPNSGPTGMVSQNGTSYLWIAESYANKIARFDTTTKKFIEFAEPMNLPLGIAVDGNGNVWASEHGGSSVDEFVPMNSTFRKYPTSPASSASGFSMTGPATVSVDKLGRIWFVEHYADRVGLLNPTTGVMAEFPIPYDSYSLLDTVDSEGNFWFTEYGADRIAMINGTVTVSIDIQAKTPQIPTVTAGQPVDLQFSVSNISPNNTTINLSTASSFRSIYQDMASEVTLNATSLSLSPGKEESVNAVVTPDFSLSTGLYSTGLVAIIGNSSVVKDVFLNVKSNILYQIENVLPYILIAAVITLALTFVLLRRQKRNRRASITQAKPTNSLILALGLFVLLAASAVGTANAKCPGLPPPPGGYTGPDPYGIALDVGSIAFFAVVAYFLIRSRLRGTSLAEGGDKAQSSKE
jgi:virginiamycin B lyase